MKSKHTLGLAALLALFSLQDAAVAQGTAFNYTGQLIYSNQPVSGYYDIQFELYADPTNGAPQATYGPISVATDANGIFTAPVDFGTSVFDGVLRWMQILVETNGLAVIALEPRQPLIGYITAVAQEIAVQRLTGGLDSTNSGLYCGICSGTGNSTGNGSDCQVCGGKNNSIAGGLQHWIGGGYQNVIKGSDGARETITGGGDNTIENNADYSSIGGGQENDILSSATHSAIAGGSDNEIQANVDWAFIAGGRYNFARQDYAFAAGYGADANHRGAFVFSCDDGDVGNYTKTTSTAANQFMVRAKGGARFYTAEDTSTGPYLNAGSADWISSSDRSLKKNFTPADTVAILEKLSQVPITYWQYQWEDESRTPHLGPTAQDFKGAFYPGCDDKGISTMEVDGVALAAIQGLDRIVREKEQRIADLEKAVLELQALVQQLMASQSGGEK